MERIKRIEKVVDGKVRYKKLGRGSLRMNGKIIKPGEIFYAYPDQIPTTFKDIIIPLDDTVEAREERQVKETIAPKVNVVKHEYSLQNKGKSTLWWDVVDSNGKVINEKGLKKEDAESLIENLKK